MKATPQHSITCQIEGAKGETGDVVVSVTFRPFMDPSTGVAIDKRWFRLASGEEAKCGLVRTLGALVLLAPMSSLRRPCLVCCSACLCFQRFLSCLYGSTTSCCACNNKAAVHLHRHAKSLKLVMLDTPLSFPPNVIGESERQDWQSRQSNLFWSWQAVSQARRRCR